ncbi:GmrSD restriction endonuclease domain-containing protein [Streptomyces alkaliphilus]|uniref:GmrSD restriction endonuclease domain-containing protein n=1 Tax=Streptomyces alkaliphilus TaxID=1472722 RepID=UPI0015671E5C
MRANETVLRDLLQGEKQYIVPLYQRTYSWKRDQLNQLWADMTSLLDTTEEESHFLGSIVLAPSPNSTASGIQSWLVVDGQQRLTTLSILLCAIRDHCHDTFPQLARKIDVQYLKNEFAQNVERYTLLPTQADRNSWTGLVERAPAADKEDGIGDAYRFFKGRLEQLLNRDGAPSEFDYQKLEKLVVSQLAFVEISAHTGDNVHRIFESLNNTGLKLTQADLLRNYIFMRLPNAAERVYERHWLPIQRLLNERELVDLIWLDLILRQGKRLPTQHSLYREQQRHLDLLGSEAEVEDWVSELYRVALVFRRILHPAEEQNPVVREALDRLHRWRASVVQPIALRTMLAYAEEEIDAQTVADVLRVVESYLVRQMIVGTGRAGINVMIGSLVNSLEDETPNAQLVTRVLSRQRGRYPSDKEVREAMIDQPFYWRGKEWQKHFILRCLEEGLGRDERIDFTSSTLTIEHVLPQTITEDWRNEIQLDLAPNSGISLEELHEQVVHTIGNLTLSAYNGRLSNKPFTEKKEILADSGLAMNLRIAREARWGPAQIRQRSEELARLAIEIWPGPDDSLSPEPQSPKLATVRQVLSEIPSGRWTNYLAVAQAAGTHRRSVSKWLVEYPLPNRHRVLTSNGSIPANLPHEVTDPERQRALLQEEGVVFGVNGRASKKCHLGFADLVRLIEGENED